MARRVLRRGAMHVRGPRLSAIVLAGGAGTRLAPLTRALYGRDLPKQFAVLDGQRSMLQRTVDRALALCPPERILVVVSREHEAIACSQVREWPELELVVQPRNLDTGPGLILPLARLRARDRSARVAVLPADHHVASPEALLRVIERAEVACRVDRKAVVLLGAAPDSADPDYGWIQSRPGRLGLRTISRFVEKPTGEVAERLFRDGAAWNTFIMVGAVERLWAIARAGLPDHADQLERCRSPAELEQAYAGLPAANFSRAVLERAADLSLLPLDGAGWSDWGTPRRVFDSLRGTPAYDRLVARITEPVRLAELAA